MSDAGIPRSAHLHDDAGRVSVEDGQVLLDGPNGVAVAMTPQAAAETGRRLIAAATAATQGDGTG